MGAPVNGTRRCSPASGEGGRLSRIQERRKAGRRAKAEYPLHGANLLFRYRKTRDRGLTQDTAQTFAPINGANQVLARGRNAQGGALSSGNAPAAGEPRTGAVP